MTWFNIIKDELSQRIKDARDFQDLREIIREGNIIGSNGRPYTVEKFNHGLNKMTFELSRIGDGEDMEGKMQRLEDMLIESKWFTRTNGLRLKVIDKLLAQAENRYPDVTRVFSNMKATQGFMGMLGIDWA